MTIKATQPAKAEPETQPAKAEPETIQKTIIKVMRDVKKVAKNEHNKAQNFSFRGIDGVMKAVAPAMREHGLMILTTSKLDKIQREEKQSRNNTFTAAIAEVGFKIMNEYGNSLETTILAEAADFSDKGVAKLHSVALRTLLIQILALPTDTPDPDSEYIEQASSMPDNWEQTAITASQQGNRNELLRLLKVAQTAKDGAAYNRIKELGTSMERPNE